MTDQVDVSVIICVRNGEATIRRQLDALDRQEGYPPFEVLVVDNGSTDATKSIVAQWMTMSEHCARSVRLVEGPRRPGIPRTRNVGAAHAVGRVLAFCDADDEVAPGWVAAHARAVDDDQLSGGRILARTANGREVSHAFRPGLIATRYLPHVGGANWAVARDTYMTVGGFDESLPRYGFDDVDFSWRVQEAGFSIVYTNAAIVHFTVSDGSTSIRKRWILGEGRVLMASRYPKYDPHHYTLSLTLRDLIVEGGKLTRDSLRTRRMNHARAGHVVALAGRVWGSIKYRGGRRLPQRQLMHPAAGRTASWTESHSRGPTEGDSCL